MAAAGSVTRPPSAHLGPNGGNLHTHSNSSGLTFEQQDPRLHGTSHDPGPPFYPQHHVPAQTVFCVPAPPPPPPPFLHYQWPMPFSYNPFSGYPGMGYGVVMPPFPPPPYLEAPAYILPHPHIQPVDYRCLLHPQFHIPSAPYQNPNLTRTIRLPHTGPVRETVNSEVQTEPTQRGLGGYGEVSPLLSSDSGRGTASNSPSSSSSSSQKRGLAENKDYTLSSSKAEDIKVKRIKNGSNVLHTTGMKTVQSCIKTTPETQKNRKDSVGQENVPPCRTGHCNMWSVSPPDGMIPVCSSSQQEVVVKERHISVPDILSWGDGTPQATMLKVVDKLSQNVHQLPSYETEVEQDKSVYRSPTETKHGPVVAASADADDAEGNQSSKNSKILKLRKAHEERKAESRGENEPVRLVDSVRHCLPYRDELLHSLNQSHNAPDSEQGNGNETNPHEDTADIIPCQTFLNSLQWKRKMNDSVWSVDSVPPFIPTKEWLLQNDLFEPQVTDSVPVADKLPQNDHQLPPYRTEVEHKSVVVADSAYTDEDAEGNFRPAQQIISYEMSSNTCQMKRKINESVWSVDSLPPFIPSMELLLHNGMFEPEVIVEMTEEAENGRLATQNDNLIAKSSKKRQTSRCSSSDSDPLSDSWLIFSASAEKLSLPKKKQEMEIKNDASEMRSPEQGQSMAPPEKDLIDSPIYLPSKMILSNSTEEDVEKNRSSEPEANQSPNQESLIVNEQQVKNSCSHKQEENLLLNSSAGERISSTGQLTVQKGVDMEEEDGACRKEQVNQLRNNHLCVPMADQKKAEVSPSKAHLVDCGIQCTIFQELKCLHVCEEKSRIGPIRRHPYKYADMNTANNVQAEGFCMMRPMHKNQKRNGQWRNREKHIGQQEAYNNYYGKPGKSQGGNGRNPRY